MSGSEKNKLQAINVFHTIWGLTLFVALTQNPVSGMDTLYVGVHFRIIALFAHFSIYFLWLHLKVGVKDFQ